MEKIYLTPTQLAILGVLTEQGCCTTSMFIQSVKRKHSTVSTALKILFEIGLVSCIKADFLAKGGIDIMSRPIDQVLKEKLKKLAKTSNPQTYIYYLTDNQLKKILSILGYSSLLKA